MVETSFTSTVNQIHFFKQNASSTHDLIPYEILKKTPQEIYLPCCKQQRLYRLNFAGWTHLGDIPHQIFLGQPNSQHQQKFYYFLAPEEYWYIH